MGTKGLTVGVDEEEYSLPTLDEFLLSKWRNQWIWDAETSTRVYLRRGPRFIPALETIVNTVDVGNIQVDEEERGRGNFSKFLKKLIAHPATANHSIFVENVIGGDPDRGFKLSDYFYRLVEERNTFGGDGVWIEAAHSDYQFELPSFLYLRPGSYNPPKELAGRRFVSGESSRFIGRGEYWPEPGTLAEALATLDLALTGKPKLEVAQTLRQRLEQDPDLENFLEGEIYYLSDGGYSRVGWSVLNEKLFLDSVSLDKAKAAWMEHPYLIGEVEQRIQIILLGEDVKFRDYDPIVNLELRCADDGGILYREEDTWSNDDRKGVEIYNETRGKHLLVREWADLVDINHYVADTDDRYSHHSDAYLYFPLTRVAEVAQALDRIDIEGDILDVPLDFPLDLENIIKGIGWNVERRL